MKAQLETMRHQHPQAEPARRLDCSLEGTTNLSPRVLRKDQRYRPDRIHEWPTSPRCPVPVNTAHTRTSVASACPPLASLRKAERLRIEVQSNSRLNTNSRLQNRLRAYRG